MSDETRHLIRLQSFTGKTVDAMVPLAPIDVSFRGRLFTQQHRPRS